MQKAKGFFFCVLHNVQGQLHIAQGSGANHIAHNAGIIAGAGQIAINGVGVRFVKKIINDKNLLAAIHIRNMQLFANMLIGIGVLVQHRVISIHKGADGGEGALTVAAQPIKMV